MSLSSCGFNNSCGALVFNHPGQVASDGTHFALADTRNNRILLWNSPPTGNTPPNMVLGQPSFETNDPGTDLGNLNWPAGVTFGAGRLIVADTRNNRLLVWNSWPTRNGQPADYAIYDPDPHGHRLDLPYALWSNGTKLVVAGRGTSNVLVWNAFPTTNRLPDFKLTENGNLGSPRYVASDGTHLVVGDYDSRPSLAYATYFWNTFPTSDTPADYTIDSIQRLQSGCASRCDLDLGRAAFLPGGGLAMLGDSRLAVWRSYPTSPTRPDVVLGTGSGANGLFQGGDTSGITEAGGRLYISLMNANLVAVYNALPTTSGNRKPDWVLGAKSFSDNTLDDHFILQSPDPVSDGKSLWFFSGFNQTMAEYTRVPNTDGARPDYFYRFQFDHTNEAGTPTQAAVYGDELVAVGGEHVWAWNALPRHGEKPDHVYFRKFGGLAIGGDSDRGGLTGVAMDAHHFYLADQQQGKIWVWNGSSVPGIKASPAYAIDLPGVYEIHSDGTYLTATSPGGHFNHFTGPVTVYKVADLGAGAQPWFQTTGSNDPMSAAAFQADGPLTALTIGNRLVVADTYGDRVLLWSDIAGASAGNPPDGVLGMNSLSDEFNPLAHDRIGRDKTFLPGWLWWDGSYLWVGEYKFSQRLLRFSTGP